MKTERCGAACMSPRLTSSPLESTSHSPCQHHPVRGRRILSKGRCLMPRASVQPYLVAACKGQGDGNGKAAMGVWKRIAAKRRMVLTVTR